MDHASCADAGFGMISSQTVGLFTVFTAVWEAMVLKASIHMAYDIYMSNDGHIKKNS